MQKLIVYKNTSGVQQYRINKYYDRLIAFKHNPSEVVRRISSSVV